MSDADVSTDAPSPGGDLKASRRRAARPASAARVDRMPPHSLEAEQGVLGCVLLSPNDAMGDCLQKLKQDGAGFYDLRHQTVYQLLAEMYDQRVGIDLITVSQRLKDKGLLEQVGGVGYLASLSDAVPSAANLSFYLETVQEKYLLRRIIQTCNGVVSRVYDHDGEVDALLDEVERDILQVAEERVEQTSETMKDLVGKAINVIEAYHSRKGELRGLATGFHDLDKMTDGLKGGEMIVIAARPSMGKTSLAMNIAEHVAVSLKLPVGVFSLEMTAESLVLRMLSSRAEVNLRKLREGFMSERDGLALRNAAGEMARAPLFIDDTAGLSVLQLRAKARRMWQQFGVRLFVIDYLQLLHSTARRADNRQQEIADISNGVKALAKELDVPVIVLSQLNRELEKREPGAKPKLSDLRESGSIEQDADVVGLLYKPGSGESDDGSPQESQDVETVKLYIAKQRNGPTGDVDLTFFRGITRFRDAARISPEDVQS